jgi:riboflavin kinase
MVKVKPVHIPTLIELLLLGAKDEYVEISTTALAKRLDKSQQAVSKHLSDLEEDGYVERSRSGGRNSVKLTKKGIAAMIDMYSVFRRILEDEEPVFKIKGELFTGLGEGAY